MDVREAVVPAGVALGALFVVDAHEVENVGVEIVDLVQGCVPSEVIGCSVDNAAFDSTAGKPHGEAEGTVSSTLGALGSGGCARIYRPKGRGCRRGVPGI